MGNRRVLRGNDGTSTWSPVTASAPQKDERQKQSEGNGSCGPQKVGSISRGDLLQPIFVVQSAEHLLNSYPTIRR